MPFVGAFPPRWRRQLRSWVRRSAFAWWAGVAVLALVTGGVVRSALVRSSALLDEVGPLRMVPVVVQPVEAGAIVGEGDVALARRPSSMLPDDDVVPDAAGRVALVPLVPGEVVVASKLAPSGLRGAAALLPEGMRALAVPAGPGGRPPASVGDRVDVLATFGATDATDGSSSPTVVVAAGALVLAVDDESDAVTIAVAAEEAPDVAYAITTGTVTLALTSPQP
jgi:Flp pilus assembly protein CpaB